jgi:hypothetical protein
MTHQASYKDGFKFEYNDDGSIPDYTYLGEVFCSDIWIEEHSRELSKLAKERNNGVIGKIYRYNNRYMRREWFVAPSIRAYWCSHSE